MDVLEFELVRDFMPVLVTGKFDDDLIKNKIVIMSIHYKFMGKFSKLKGM